MTSDSSAAPMRGKHQPDRDDIVASPRLTITEHPLTLSLLARIRDGRTDIFEFGALATQLASRVLWEACNDVRLAETKVPNYAGRPNHRPPARRTSCRSRVSSAPDFSLPPRSADFFLTRHFIRSVFAATNEAFARSSTATICQMYHGWTDRILILDPMLATGGSAVAALKHVRRSHTGNVSVVSLIAAPLGVQIVLDADPEIARVRRGPRRPAR